MHSFAYKHNGNYHSQNIKAEIKWPPYFSTSFSCMIIVAHAFGFKFQWNVVPEVQLTHWGRVTHICVSDLTSIGSDNGLSPGRRQAIIRTNAGILLIRPLGTNFSEFLVEILIFKKMRLKVSSAKRRPFCLGLNELTAKHQRMYVHRWGLNQRGIQQSVTKS